MLESLMKYPEVKEFLSDYPRAKWQVCVDSIFLYGLHTIIRNFDFLTIPELIQLSGAQVDDYNLEKSYKVPSGSSRRGSKVSIITDEQTQTSKKILKKPQIYLKNPAYLPKNYRCETFTNLNTQKYRDKEFFPHNTRYEEPIDDLVSESIKEPDICPLENAKTLLRNESYDGMKGKNNKNLHDKKNSDRIEIGDDSYNYDYWIERFSSSRKEKRLNSRQ
ncbi:hypothetical protein SteCoe_38514 [Stentor coeruleus]|uniref:Uncharacterized protein n=1 Tax=Stentor coeruleus TaxID=5963 RepID=A0A1R2ALM6_9CILI|nr:hypothetical protein SteCoe_38514 [Stentor coeruleus]